MKVSSRWYVSAFVAFGALGCSDPVPATPQGAFNARITSSSAAPAGKNCPSGTSTYFEAPTVPDTKDENGNPKDERLDSNTYIYKVVDGDSGKVSCSVKNNAFEGRIEYGNKSLAIRSGTVDPTSLKGTARIEVVSESQISGVLSSPGTTCTIDASKSNGANFQIENGHIWASFSCPSVEQTPTTFCGASGVFVLENCAK
jgi:hypothetical protein